MRLLEERLNTLFFHNENAVKNIMDNINNYYMKITKVIEYIKKLNGVLKYFYPIKHEKDIEFIINFEKKLKDGKFNIIEDKEVKNTIDRIYQILPDLEIKNALKESIFLLKCLRR